MKRALAALLGVLVVLGAALYFFVARPILRPSEVTAVAESALATEDLLVLGGINVRQAVFLERWFLGTPRASTAQAVPATAAVADRSLLEHLRAAGVDARHDVDHALYALYPAAAETARHAVVLVGRFNPTAINAYLTRELRRGGAGRGGAGILRGRPHGSRHLPAGRHLDRDRHPGVDHPGGSRPRTPPCCRASRARRRRSGSRSSGGAPSLARTWPAWRSRAWIGSRRDSRSRS